MTEDLPDDLDLDEDIPVDPNLARRIEVTFDETADGQRLDRALADAVPELSRETTIPMWWKEVLRMFSRCPSSGGFSLIMS